MIVFFPCTRTVHAQIHIYLSHYCNLSHYPHQNWQTSHLSTWKCLMDKGVKTTKNKVVFVERSQEISVWEGRADSGISQLHFVPLHVDTWTPCLQTFFNIIFKACGQSWQGGSRGGPCCRQCTKVRLHVGYRPCITCYTVLQPRLIPAWTFPLLIEKL